MKQLLLSVGKTDLCVCRCKGWHYGLFWRESPDVPSFSRTLEVFVTVPTCSASTFSCSPD